MRQAALDQLSNQRRKAAGRFERLGNFTLKSHSQPRQHQEFRRKETEGPGIIYLVVLRHVSYNSICMNSGLNTFGKLDLETLSKKFQVNDLFIYINAYCNLNCRYCNTHLLDKALKREPLSLENFGRAFKKFVKIAKRPEVTFFGGEPLVYPERLMGLVKIIRDYDKLLPVTIFTNGTLINKKIIDYARKNRLNLHISLDGGKKTNDANRAYTNRDESVHDKVVKKISTLKLFDLSTAQIVIDRNNIHEWHNNINHLVGLGFESVYWSVNYYGDWETGDIKIFKQELKKIFTQHIEHIKKNKKPYRLSNINGCLSEEPEIKTEDFPVMLFNDGNFYPSEEMALFRNAGESDKQNIGKLAKLVDKEGLTENDLSCVIGWQLLKHKDKKDSSIIKKMRLNRKIKETIRKELLRYTKILKRSGNFLKIYKVDAEQADGAVKTCQNQKGRSG